MNICASFLASLLGSTAWVGLCAGHAIAQGAPPVYRCQTGDRVVYSHEPCVGARVVDTTPTRGLDKDSGRARKGADVSREERRELIADALKPLTGLDAKQLEKAGHRQKLDASSRQECSALDVKLVNLQKALADAPASGRSAAEGELFVARNRFRALRC